MTLSYEERLVIRIKKRTKLDPETGCWVSQHQYPNGYGELFAYGKKRRAHRVTYELFVGPIPPETPHLDHLCRNPSCCNPEHLEPVTALENARRGISAEVNRTRMLAKTHCKQGHEYTPENTRYSARQRNCRKCGALHAAAYALAHPEMAAEHNERRKARDRQPCPLCGGIKPPGRGVRYCDACRGPKTRSLPSPFPVSEFDEEVPA